MLPYFPQPGIHLFGPVTFHAFGGLVALAVIVGWRLGVAHDHPGTVTTFPLGVSLATPEARAYIVSFV